MTQSVKTFNDIMREPPPPLIEMPPAIGGAGVNAAQAWQDAISGRSKPLGLADTQACAESWMSQFDAMTGTTVKVL